jgi:hypothetical protein
MYPGMKLLVVHLIFVLGTKFIAASETSQKSANLMRNVTLGCSGSSEEASNKGLKISRQVEMTMELSTYIHMRTGLEAYGS